MQHDSLYLGFIPFHSPSLVWTTFCERTKWIALRTQKSDESDSGERHSLDPEPGGVDAARPDLHVLVAGEGRVLRGQGGLSCCSKAEVVLLRRRMPFLGMFC